MEHEMSVSIVFCTVPDTQTAQKIASALVEQRLAACVKLLDNVTSVYRWQDNVEQDNECQLLIKTAADKVSQAYALVVSMHPYDEPEWVEVPQVSGSSSYLTWVLDQTRT